MVHTAVFVVVLGLVPVIVIVIDDLAHALDDERRIGNGGAAYP